MRDDQLRFAPYRSSPDAMEYNGGPESLRQLQYLAADEKDRDLTELILQFQSAYPYLYQISSAAGIRQSIDSRVLEAYWIGNELLKISGNLELSQAQEKKALSRITDRLQRFVTAKRAALALPNHSFHIFDVLGRAGSMVDNIEVLDQCRISWGAVISVEADTARVVTRSLQLTDRTISLADPKILTANWRSNGGHCMKDIKSGDVVTLHWNWICEVISPSHARVLERATQRHITLANQTL